MCQGPIRVNDGHLIVNRALFLFLLFHTTAVNPKWMKDAIKRNKTNKNFVLGDFLKMAD